MSAWQVEPACEADKAWIDAIFNADARYLASNFTTIWWRWLNRSTERDRWLVVRPYGFAHYLARLDGVQVLYEMAVRTDMRRRGIGTALLAAIGRPVELKTDCDNEASNSFYLARGFCLTGMKASRDGARLMNLYRLE
jgi:GNAT superfamily N-acetyltransferase